MCMCLSVCVYCIKACVCKNASRSWVMQIGYCQYMKPRNQRKCSLYVYGDPLPPKSKIRRMIYCIESISHITFDREEGSWFQRPKKKEMLKTLLYRRKSRTAERSGWWFEKTTEAERETFERIPFFFVCCCLFQVVLIHPGKTARCHAMHAECKLCEDFEREERECG